KYCSSCWNDGHNRSNTRICDSRPELPRFQRMETPPVGSNRIPFIDCVPATIAINNINGGIVVMRAVSIPVQKILGIDPCSCSREGSIATVGDTDHASIILCDHSC